MTCASERNDSNQFNLQMTGAPLEVTIRFQANFLVRPVEELSIFQDVKEILMPAMWFEQKFVMDSDMASQIRSAVQIPWIGKLVGLVLFAVGIVFLLISTCIACAQSRSKATNDKMEIGLGDSKVAARLKVEGFPLLNRVLKPQIVQQRSDIRQ